MSEDSSEEKELPASERKLRKAREQGEVPHSQEMVTAISIIVGFGYLVIRAPSFAAAFEDGVAALPAAYGKPFSEALGMLAGRLLTDMLAVTLPLLALIVAAAVITNLTVNGGLVVALDPILPKAERLDPIEGFKRLFELRNVVELSKSFLKLGTAIYSVFWLTRWSLQSLVEIPACGLPCGLDVLGVLVKDLLLILAGLFLALGLLDVGLQQWLFRRDQRMTKSELKKELKDADGDPLIKQEHRKEHMAEGQRTGRRAATFALCSPTAVLAMRYDQSDCPVPTLVARAVGEGVPILIDDLRLRGVPILFDEATVAALVPRLKMGAAISEDMYPPVIQCMREAGIL